MIDQLKTNRVWLELSKISFGKYTKLYWLVFFVLFSYLSINCYFGDSEIWEITSAKRLFEASDFRVSTFFRLPFFILINPLYLLSSGNFNLLQDCRLVFSLIGAGIVFFVWKLSLAVFRSNKIALLATILLATSSFFLNRGFRVRPDILASFFNLMIVFIIFSWPRIKTKNGKLFNLALLVILNCCLILTTQKSIYFLVAIWFTFGFLCFVRPYREDPVFKLVGLGVIPLSIIVVTHLVLMPFSAETVTHLILNISPWDLALFRGENVSPAVFFYLLVGMVLVAEFVWILKWHVLPQIIRDGFVFLVTIGNLLILVVFPHYLFIILVKLGFVGWQRYKTPIGNGWSQSEKYLALVNLVPLLFSDIIFVIFSVLFFSVDTSFLLGYLSSSFQYWKMTYVGDVQSTDPSFFWWSFVFIKRLFYRNPGLMILIVFSLEWFCWEIYCLLSRKKSELKRRHAFLFYNFMIFCFLLLHSEKLPFFIAAMLPTLCIGAAYMFSLISRFIVSRILAGKYRSKISQVQIFGLLMVVLIIKGGYFYQLNLRVNNNQEQKNVIEYMEKYIDKYERTTYYDGIGILPKKNTFYHFLDESTEAESLQQIVLEKITRERPPDLLFITGKMLLLEPFLSHWMRAEYVPLSGGIWAKALIMVHDPIVWKNQQPFKKYFLKNNQLPKQEGKARYSFVDLVTLKKDIKQNMALDAAKDRLYFYVNQNKNNEDKETPLVSFVYKDKELNIFVDDKQQVSFTVGEFMDFVTAIKVLDKVAIVGISRYPMVELENKRMLAQIFNYDYMY